MKLNMTLSEDRYAVVDADVDGLVIVEGALTPETRDWIARGARRVNALSLQDIPPLTRYIIRNPTTPARLRRRVGNASTSIEDIELLLDTLEREFQRQ